MAHKILVIEDEPTLARLLTYNLQQEGYETEVADHGEEGLRLAQEKENDLIILDLMLPGLSGFEILERLRKQNNRTPVIILTARHAEEEIVQGLKLGADDYMTKPFGVAELLARVSAVLRRTLSGEEAEQQTDEQIIEIGELQIFPEKYEALLSGESLSLRPKEFEMLMYLVRNPGKVVTRDLLMNSVWGFDYFGGQRTVDVHVSTLRKKLETNQQSIRIESIRGVGYKLVITKER